MRPDPRESRPDPTADGIFEFGEFRLDSANRLLTRNGDFLTLPSRAFDTLVYLARRPSELVTKDELLNGVWSGAFVEESNLTVAISTIRRVLGEDAQQRRFIQTVSGRGYRFISEVRLLPPGTRGAQLTAAAAPLQVAPSPAAAAVNPASETAPIATAAPIDAAGTPDRPFSAVQQTSAVQAAAAAEADPEALPAFRKTGLRVALAALLLASVAITAVAVWRHSMAAPAAGLRVHTLAVLPSAGPGASEEEAIGTADALIAYLGNRVAVRPLSSVLKYAAASADPVAVGREQNVDAVVLSHLESNDRGLRLNLRVLGTANGQTVWQRSYQDTRERLASLQAAADQDLSDWLLKVVDKGSARPASATAVSVKPEAYRLYLRGRYFWNRRTDEALRQSIAAFRQSIEIDPNYAPAYAGLADAYTLLSSFSVESGRNANPDARAAALSAIQLDPTLAEPHASLGMIYFFIDWNGAAAEQEFERAIALNPNYATAHHWYALDLAAMGRFAQAKYEIRRAQELDPLSMIIGTNVGWIDYLNRQNDAAITEYRKVLELDPSFVRARTRIGIAQMQAGSFDEAVASLQLAEQQSSDPYIAGLLGEALARDGKSAAAGKILQELQSRSKVKYVPPFSLALIYLGMNRRAEALQALEQAAQDRSTSMVYARIDPSLDALRGDPRFQAIVTAMHF